MKETTSYQWSANGIMLVLLAFVFSTLCHAAAPYLHPARDPSNHLNEIDSNPLGGRTPLILIHGIREDVIVWDEFLTYWKDRDNSDPFKSTIKPYTFNYSTKLEDISATDPTHIQQVGEYLRSQIEQTFGINPTKQPIILAHSMGGLVARSMMQEFTFSDGITRCGDRIAGVITLATPHHGTPLANVFVQLSSDPSISAQYAAQKINAVFDCVFPMIFNMEWDYYDAPQGTHTLNSWLKGLNSYHGGFNYPNTPTNILDGYYNKLICYAGYTFAGDASWELIPTYKIISDAGYSYNDGAVPFVSAAFAAVAVHATRTVFDDHFGICKGGFVADNKSHPDIFSSIAQDIRNFIPPATSGGTPVPVITAVSPSSFPSSSSSVPITIIGSAFTNASTLTFQQGSKPPLTPRTPTFVNSHELQYAANVGLTPSPWTVQVVNGGVPSNAMPFTVTAPSISGAPAAPIAFTPIGGTLAKSNFVYFNWTNPNDSYGITKIWIKFGSPPSSATDGSPYALPANKPLALTLPISSGQGAVYAWLEDGASNKSAGNYALATVKIDRNPPSIFSTINSTSTSTTNVISINGTLADDYSGIAGLAWANDLGGSGSANVVKSGDGLSATWSIPSVQLASGANHITFTATDNTGNASQLTVTVNYYDGSTNGSGSVQVTITPQSVVSAGAQWRFAGEVLWHNSGDVVNSYTGTRTVNFSPVNGWTPPADTNVTVNGGQTTSVSGTYTVPITSQAPYVPSTPYPVNGAVNVSRNPLTLSWLGGSPNGTVTYALAMDTNPNVSISTAPITAGYGGTNGSSFPVVATLQPATTYYWRVYTKDYNGNVTIGPAWSFITQYAIPDLIPANLSIDGNITPNSTVTAHVTVTNQGSFTAQGAYVNLYLSHTPGAKETQLNAVHSLYLPTALAPGQSETLSAQIALSNLQTGQSFLDAWIDSSPWGANAETNYNNNTMSLAISYIDGAPPTVSYFAPQIAFAKTGAPMTFVVQASDDDSIKTLDFYYSMDGGTTWTPIQEGYAPPTSPANGVTYSWTVPTTLTVGGNLLLRVVATDPSGNFGEKIAGPYLVHDGTAPAVTVIFPNGGEALPAGSTQQFRWTVSAPNGVSNASLSLWLNSSTVTTQDITTNSNGTYSWTLPANATSNISKIQVRVTDGSGNTSEDWSDAPFAIVDTSQPPPAPWNPATAVTAAASGDPAGIPKIVADSTGTVHLLYGLTHNASTHTISFRYRKRTGTTWTNPTVVSFDTSTVDSQIGASYSIGEWRFALDSNNYPHLVWATSYDFNSEQNKNDVFYTYFNGTSWSAPQNISSTIRGPFMEDTLAWVRKADIPVADSNTMAVAAVWGKLYYIYHEQIYQYDPATNIWTRKADATADVVNDGGATVVGSLIYAAGSPSDGNMHIYNPSTNSWSTGAAMPSPQQGIRLTAAANGMVYAVGGVSDRTKNRMFNPGTNSWATMANVPTSRSYPAVASVGSKVYVIGGAGQQSMDIYDTVANTWTTRNYPAAANIPNSTGGFACAANNRLYFIPGASAAFATVSHDVWEYDPATGGWVRMIPTQFGHGWAFGAAIGSKFYVLGGVDGFNTVSSMEEATISAGLVGTVSFSPRIAIDGSNAVHVLWRDGGYNQPDGSSFSSLTFAGQQNVFEAVKNESVWSGPGQITTGGVNRHALAVDQVKNLHLSYLTYGSDLAYIKRIGSAWSSPTLAGQIVSNGRMDVAVDSTSKVHVLYSDYDQTNNLNSVKYITLSGNVWSSPERVSPISGGLVPRICLDSLNRPHAIWEGGGVDPQVLYSTKNGGGWVAPIQLNRASELPVFGTADAALISGNNELDVVWLCSNSGNPNVLLSYANVGSATDVYSPSVIVNSPVPGNALSIGVPTAITWTAADNVGVTSVDLHYSTDNGTTWNAIAAGLPNSGLYSWTVANAASMRIRVMAHDAAGNIGVGISASFSGIDVSPPSVVITSPTGGITLTGKATLAVAWTATDNVGVTGVDLEYSTDSGNSWLPIASALSNIGSYPMTVPNIVTSGFLIRVTAHDNSGLATAALSQPASIVAGNTPPTAPNSPFPIHTAANVGLALPLLQWSSGDADGDPLTYEIHFGTTSNPPVVATGAIPTYTPPPLNYQTTYYWQIVASDGKVTTAGPIWNFQTAPSPFNLWRAAHFTAGQLGDPSVSGWNADANASGIPNGLKFFFDLNSTTAMSPSDRSALPQAGMELSGGRQYLTLTYRQNLEASALGVQLQVSPDLTPNSWLPVIPDFTQSLTPDPITGDPRIKVMVNVTGQAKKFVRLQVTGP